MFRAHAHCSTPRSLHSTEMRKQKSWNITFSVPSKQFMERLNDNSSFIFQLLKQLIRFKHTVQYSELSDNIEFVLLHSV